jgi:hypothetical protein
MEYQAPKSKCLLCNSEFTSRGIGRHISTCLKKQPKISRNKLAKKYSFISVRDLYDQDYFIFLLVSQHATLDDLDSFLRKIWLECCGHMSAFSYGKWGEEIPMSTNINNVASIGYTLNYKYDFGSTTELIIKFIGDHKGSIEDHEKIKILSRNSQAIVPCDECAKFPAVEICTECQCDGGGWLCENCIKNHECGEEMLLPVVNSPRAGVCAYRGEIEERPIPQQLLKAIKARKKKTKIIKIK